MLALTQAGVSREDAYRLVQKSAMTAWHGGGDFLALLKADAEVTKAMSEAQIEACFDLGYHTKAVDEIFERVFA
jgi:adenylosuccinate lyase